MDTDEFDEQVKDYLIGLSHADLLRLLQEVFEVQIPYEGESFSESKFFLGIAIRELDSEPDEPDHWGPWTVGAACEPNPSHYPGISDFRPTTTDPFFQHGTCDNCQVEMHSYLKNGICAICGSQVALT